MSQRPAFAVQVLEKLGAPLVGAAAARAEDPDPRRTAEKVAELLGKSVQLGVGLSSAMDLRDNDAKGDSLRLALVSLAARLVANEYKSSGRVPDDADMKRLTTGLEAVLTFADSFAPAADATARLEALDGMPVPHDDIQAAVQYISALTPVIGTVASFSFGRPEKKLVQEIADRLVSRSAALRKSITASGDKKTQKQAELRLLSLLAGIYVDCHQEQMSRFMAMDEKKRGEMAQAAGGLLPMEPVWDSFELRAGMAEILAAGHTDSGGTAGNAGFAPAAAIQPPAQKAPPPSIPGMQKPAAETPPTAAAPESAPPSNPMGFFKKKQDDGSSG